MTKTSLKACLMVFALAVAAPGLASAQGGTAGAAPAPVAPLTDPAAKQIRAFYDALLDSMKHAKEVDVKGRYKKLQPAVDASFDFATMTERTIGPGWAGMSQADRDALTDAFRRMTIADYAHNFDGYSGEVFVVDPNVQDRAGDKIVSTQMTAPDRPPIPFAYRLNKTAAGWKIADVFLNGYVSEVATRRADFASTLASGGAAALIAKLNALTDKLLAGP